MGYMERALSYRQYKVAEPYHAFSAFVSKVGWLRIDDTAVGCIGIYKFPPFWN